MARISVVKPRPAKWLRRWIGNSAQRLGRTFPDEPQGVQSKARSLDTCRQLRLLEACQPDFLWANVIVHARERLQTLHFVAKQVVDFVEGRLAQCGGLGLCQICGGLEHGGECPANDFGIFDQLVG